MLHNKTILIVKPRILCSNKTYFWAPDIPCNHDLFTIFRSSHRRCSIKKGVLENFANFIGKHLCRGLLFNKVGGLKPALLKGEFPANFAKSLITPFWQNTSRNCLRIFQNIHIKNGFRSSRPEVFCKKGVLRNLTKFAGRPLCLRPATLLKEILVQGFSCEFCEISKNTFLYKTPLLAAFNYKRLKRIIKFRNYFLPLNLSLRCWFSGEAVCRCFSK